MSDRFMYVTYIRTTPAKLWDALLKPEFNRAWWFGMWQDSDWRQGSPWQLKFSDGRVSDVGEVIEIDPPRRLVVSWRNESKPGLKEEGFSRATFELEQRGESVKLTVTHQIGREGSKFIESVSGGWPMVLASLKSLLETGEALPDPRDGGKCG